MISVHFILGFLGAGKTTFIKSFLRTLPDLKKVQLIVNDFGQEQFDSEILKAEGVEAVELSQGCLCCGLMESFRQVLLENAERTDIDRIIIEPSGIFVPDEIIRLFNDPVLAKKLTLYPIINIVNTELFIEKNLTRLPFIERQIQCSNRIVLNRTAHIPTDALNRLKEQLVSINSGLAIFTDPVDKDIPGLITSIGINSKLQPGYEIRMGIPDHSFSTVQVTDQLEFSNFDALMQWLRDKGSGLMRAKGAAKVDGSKVLVNYTPGELNLDDCPQSVAMGITLIFENQENS